MRIALVMDHFDPTRGGAENVAVWLARALAKRGHEVHVICHDVAPRINRYRAATQRASHDAHRSRVAHGNDAALPDGLHIHRLRGIKLSNAIGYRLFRQRVAMRCRRVKADVVHSLTLACPGDIFQPIHGIHAALQAQAIASRSTSRAAKLKTWMLKLSAKQRTLITLEKKTLANPRGKGPRIILSMSPLMSRELHDFYKVPPARIAQLAHPLLEPLIKRRQPEPRQWFRGNYGIPDDAHVALFVGHDFRRKGLRHAMDALRHATTNWQLLVVGLGKVREYIELAEKWGLSQRVRFVGPTNAIEHIYPAADILILPTYYDPCPLVVIEALAHRLPVITTAHNGFAETIARHQAGIIVPSPKDAPTLAHALDVLAGPAGLHKYVHATAAALAACSIAADEYVDKILALYQSVSKTRA